MIESNLPFLFSGEKRLYRVVGVQGDTIFGLNISTGFDSKGKNTITFAFACLGDLSDQSPFKKRSPAVFSVFNTSDVSKKSEARQGYRLQKLVNVLGENLNVFAMLKHVENSLLAMYQWLDQTLEQAGVMPSYNCVEEIFDYFFNVNTLKKTVFMFSPPTLGTYKLSNDFDFTKYNGEAEF